MTRCIWGSAPHPKGYGAPPQTPLSTFFEKKVLRTPKNFCPDMAIMKSPAGEPRKRQARKSEEESTLSSSLFLTLYGRLCRPPLRLMFNLLFLPSVSSLKSAIDTLISFALFPPRDLKLRLTVQALSTSSNVLGPFNATPCSCQRVEKRGEILKRGEKIHRLPSL